MKAVDQMVEKKVYVAGTVMKSRVTNERSYQVTKTLNSKKEAPQHHLPGAMARCV